MTELLYLVLVYPTKGLREVVSRRPLGWAMVLIIISSLINASVSQKMSQLMFQRLGLAGMAASPSIAASIIGGLIGIFIITGIWHTVARLLRGRGSYLGLLCGVAFAFLPIIFLAPLALIASYLGMAGLALFGLGMLALSLWTYVLTILAIKYSHNFSTLKAVITFIMPAAAIIPLAILFALLIALIA